jgi:periplasmic protein TonB
MKFRGVKIAFLLIFPNFIHEKLSSQTKDSLMVIGARERSAEYPGGQAEMYKFLANNLRYPKEGTSCVEGNVYINFCVEEDGSVTKIRVLKGLCKECDAEAIRVISAMPKWFPALEYGTKKPIKSYFTMPCRFRLH